jgi:hypothetical protein
MWDKGVVLKLPFESSKSSARYVSFSLTKFELRPSRGEE